MSNSPFVCFRDILPATGTIVVSFFKCVDLDSLTISDFLLTGTFSSLNVYKIIRRTTELNESISLQHVYTSKIYGRIRDVSCYLNRVTNEHIFVLSFDSGKFVQGYYDLNQNEFVSIKLFNIEETAIGTGSNFHLVTSGQMSFPGLGATPQISVHADGTIACSVIHGRYLFFLPLVNNVQDFLKCEISSPFIKDVATMGLTGPVIDFTFLTSGGRESINPLLAILQESLPLPVGHVSKVRNVCTLTILSVDASLGHMVILWQQHDLPHDSTRVLSFSHTHAETLCAIVSMNALLFITRNQVTGLAVNDVASVTVSSVMKLHPWPSRAGWGAHGIELDRSQWVCAAENTLVASLKDGALFSFSLVFASEGGLSDVLIIPELLYLGSRCTHVSCSKDSSLWFLASSNSDALLLRASTQVVEGGVDDLVASYGPGSSSRGGTSTPAQKRSRRSSSGSITDCLSPPPYRRESLSAAASHVLEEEENLYGARLSHGKSGFGALGTGPSPTFAYTGIRFDVCDFIPVLGGIRSGVFCASDEWTVASERLSLFKLSLIHI